MTSKLASALEAGLNLGRGTLDNLVTDLGQKTRDGAAQLAEGNSPQLLLLERLREQMGARSVTLVGIGGQILLESGGDTRHLTPIALTPTCCARPAPRAAPARSKASKTKPRAARPGSDPARWPVCPTLSSGLTSASAT